jgi:hypothetical protein
MDKMSAAARREERMPMKNSMTACETLTWIAFGAAVNITEPLLQTHVYGMSRNWPVHSIELYDDRVDMAAFDRNMKYARWPNGLEALLTALAGEAGVHYEPELPLKSEEIDVVVSTLLAEVLAPYPQAAVKRAA